MTIVGSASWIQGEGTDTYGHNSRKSAHTESPGMSLETHAADTCVDKEVTLRHLVSIYAHNSHHEHARTGFKTDRE